MRQRSWHRTGRPGAGPPLPSTSATCCSKSTSSSPSPHSSPARIPVSTSSRMIAVSRRFSKVLPAAGRQQRGQRVVLENGHWLLWNRRRAHPLHRRARDLAVVQQPLEQLLQRAVVLGDGGRRETPFAHIARYRSTCSRAIPRRRRHAARGQVVAEGAARSSGRTAIVASDRPRARSEMRQSSSSASSASDGRRWGGLRAIHRWQSTRLYDRCAGLNPLAELESLVFTGVVGRVGLEPTTQGL